MSVPRLEDVLDTIGAALSTVINEDVVAGGVGAKGDPVATELVKILGSGKTFVGIKIVGDSKNETRYDPWDLAIQVPPTVNLTQGISGQVLTFGGTPSAGLNIFAFVGYPLNAVLVQTVSADTLSTIAAKVAAAVTAAAVPGVTAVASGDAVTFTGCPKLACTIGGSGSYLQEVGRETAIVQVSIYAPTSTLRFQIGQAIKTQVGTARTRHYALSDNMDLYLRYRGQRLVDKAQSSYGCLEWHLSFEAEYPETLTIPATQVGAGEAIQIMNSNAPITSYSA